MTIQASQQMSATKPTGGTPVTSALWLLWAVLLAGGLIAAEVGSAGSSEFGRLGSSVTLVAAGWAWSITCRNSPAAGYTRLIAAGMTLGALGDFFMAGRLQTLIPLPSPVLGGMAAFGLGHVVYIKACLNARRAGDISPAAIWTSVVVWQVISAVAWYLIVFRSTKVPELVWPALPYSQLLAGTAGVATGLAVRNSRFTLLAVGAGLFLISDLILAWPIFHHSFPHSTAAIWIPYGGGQMLIVYAITTARHAFSDR